jgi:hypothetical protein
MTARRLWIAVFAAGALVTTAAAEDHLDPLTFETDAATAFEAMIDAGVVRDFHVAFSDRDTCLVTVARPRPHDPVFATTHFTARCKAGKGGVTVSFGGSTIHYAADDRKGYRARLIEILGEPK